MGELLAPSLRELPLSPAYLHRLRAFAGSLNGFRNGQSEHAKSDYWRLHADRAKIEFSADRVRLGGDSGMYVPGERSLRRDLATHVRRAYRRAVLLGDRGLGLSANSLAASLTPDLAYDFVFGGKVAFEEGCYIDNPSHFDVSQVKPRFATFDQLRRGWFLRDRFQAAGPIVYAAFYHAVFNHFRSRDEAPRYLEIGAGNGNLASFFHHYEGAKVTIVDLPETILFSASYLGSIFPDASVLLPSEIPDVLTAETIAAHDFVFLTPEQAARLPGKTYDMVVNCFSMQEMTMAQVREYFELIARAGRSGAIWANVNRVEKFCTRTEPPTRAAEYPYDRRNRVLVDQIDEFIQLTGSFPHILHIEQLAA